MNIAQFIEKAVTDIVDGVDAARGACSAKGVRIEVPDQVEFDLSLNHKGDVAGVTLQHADSERKLVPIPQPNNQVRFTVKMHNTAHSGRIELRKRGP